MSALASDKNEPINILFTLHDGFDSLDYVGPMELLKSARHDIKNPCNSIKFHIVQKLVLTRDFSYLGLRPPHRRRK